MFQILSSRVAIALGLLTFFSIELSVAQCPQIEAIMIDACGTEQWNEFVIIHSGGGFNTSEIELDFDPNNNFAGQQNNDININANPCGLTAGNIGAYTGCSNLIAVGPGVNIPPNAIVVLQTSAGSQPGTYNFSNLCGGGQCVFVISSTCVRTGGAFTNGGGNGTRTTNFSIAGGCNQSITYDLQQVPVGNGTYMLPLTGTFGNDGCVAPPTSAPFPPPNINPIANVTACGAYTLPAIAGTNLTPNAAYYTGPNGTGTKYDPGDVITTTTTLYAFDSNGPGCSDQEQFTVTIIATPTVNPPSDQTACAGQQVTVNFTGSPGATFQWTNNNTAIGLGASGSGNISFTATNPANPEVGTITVTPVQGSCQGTPVTFTITVNPGPTVDNPGDQTACAGQQVTVNFTSPAGNPTFNWTNSNTAIGLGASGSGNISFTAASPANPITGTISVTATQSGCTGPAQTFTITINPAATVNPPANQTACAGQQVTVNFTGSSGATFEWTNDNTAIGLPASGSGNLNFTAAGVSSPEVGTITVTPTSPAGCVGTPVTFTITVNPNPTMDNPGDQTACGGDAVNVVFTSPSGNPTYSWTNNNTAIGLPASGTGNISFTAANPATPQTATIIVTPLLGGCTGTAQTFTIAVTPRPSVNPLANQVACGGQTVTVNFSGTSGATFEWTNSNQDIGLPASGTGNISFTATNPADPQTATITVTPQLGNCTGNSISFTITINPTPAIDPVGDVFACAGEFISVVFSSPAGNPTYTWTNSNPAIGLGAAGVGNLNFNAANTGSSQTGLITVTPQLGGCSGTPTTFNISVSPTPTMGQPANASACGGSTVNVAFAGTPGATFGWTNNNPNIGLPPSGTGNISFASANPENVEVATITVTPVLNGCPGLSRTFTITIRPTPEVDLPENRAVCGGDPVSVVFTSPTGNPTYTWTNDNTAIGLGAAGVGNLNFTSAVVAAPQTATILVTPSQAGCTGPAVAFTIIVSPAPIANPVDDVEACVGQAQNIALSGSPGASFIWTNDNTATGLAASGSGNAIVFTPANVGAPEVSVVTVTPVIGSCSGPSTTFEIEVRPTPVMDPIESVTVCAGESVAILFSGTSNASFTWTNDNPTIGLPAQGVGNLNFVAAPVSAPQTAQITVAPELGGCIGLAQAFSLTVTPSGALPPLPDVAVCSGDTIFLPLTGPGTSASWTNSNPGIGLPASGTGDIQFVAAPVSSLTQAVMSLTLTPETGTCPEAIGSFILRVKPTVSLDQPGDQLVCAGELVEVLFSNPNVHWTNDNPAIGLPLSGIGALNFTAAAVNKVETANISVTSTAPAGYAYVTNIERFVSVIDLGTNTVITNIPTGGSRAYGVAVSPDGSRVYVGGDINSNNGTLLAIDAATYAVVASVSIGYPMGIAVSPDGSKVYVNSSSSPSALVVLDAQTLAVQNVLSLPVASSLEGIAISPDGSTAYLGSSDKVVVVDLLNYTTTELPAPVSANIRGVDIDPSGRFLFSGLEGVTPPPAGRLWVVDLTTNNTAALVAVGNAPNGVVFNPLNGLVYVANENSDNVSVVEPATGVVVATVPVGSGPIGISVTPNGERVYVACLGGEVYALNTADNTVAAVVGVGGPAVGFGRFIAPAQVCLGAPQTFQITVTPQPTALPVSDITACGGQQINLAFSLSPGASVQWTNDNPAIGLPASGAGDLSFTSAAVSAPQTASITATPVFGDCFGAPISFALTVVPGNADTLFIGNTTCDPNATGTFTQNLTNQFGCDSVVITTVTLLPADTTLLSQTTCDPNATGTFTQNLTNQFGCDSVIITTVTLDLVGCAPVVSVSVQDPLCAGQASGSFAIQAQGGQLPLTFAWMGAGSNGSGQITSFATPAVVANLTAGFYAITVTDVNGLTAEVSATLTAPPPLTALASVTSNFGGFGVRCANSADGSALVTAAGGTLPYVYAWDTGSFSPQITGLSAGTYSVEVRDANGCTATASLTLTAPPPLSFVVQAGTVDCGDTLLDISVVAVGGLSPYQLALNGNAVAGPVPGLPAGAHVVTVQDANGCAIDSSITIVLPPAPAIWLPADTSVVMGHALTIEATTNLTTWQRLVWEPLPDSACANCLRQTWTPDRTQRLMVHITDESGCTASARMWVRVLRTMELYVPNAVRPKDGDPANSIWRLSAGQSVVALREVAIFDRWGDLLYRWTTPIPPNEWPGWDGTTRGQKAAPGVYVYALKVLLADGSEEIVKGDFTLVE